MVSLLYIVLQCFVGTTRFQKGESWFDEQKSGRPTTTKMCENIAHVVDILKEDRRSSCRLIAERTGIPKNIEQHDEMEILRTVCAAYIDNWTKRAAS